MSPLQPKRALGMLAWLSVLLSASQALARPGGGHTFGGGSSDDWGGGGGGGGDGGAELIYLLIRLVFYYPKLGIPLLLIAAYFWWKLKRARPESWTSSHSPDHGFSPSSAAAPIRRAGRGTPAPLSALVELDPEFSRVVFEDFCFRLYASAYRARGKASELAALAPYFTEETRGQLMAESPSGRSASNVVVGSLRIEQLSITHGPEAEGFAEIALHYEANVTFPGGPAEGAEQTFYRQERWLLRRAASARTKPPEETERLGCPNCGAPFSSADGRRCAYCNQVVADGRFAWQVVQRSILVDESRSPALTSSVAERGTDRPTVRDPELSSGFEQLLARDPSVKLPSLETRTRLIYDELNRGWSDCDLSRIRALVSDGMFDYLRYWVEAYQAQGLRNVLEDMTISRMETAKVVHDKHFDAITLRLFASGRDYTVRAGTGQLVSGSKSASRSYSEYWTLIRSSEARGAARADATCPSCAAPLTVTMAGQCGHCGSHLTRGEFDWVLSKIEQDDVYEG
jgi:hypothetical protein